MHFPNKYFSIPAIIVAASASAAYAVDYISIEEAQKLSFPSAIKFEKAHIFFSPEQKREIENESGIKVLNKAQKIWKVKDHNNQDLGWFVVDYVIGKHQLIDYAVAIDKNREVQNVEILSYRESYGGEIRSKSWLKQFNGKSSKSKIKLHNDIVNISGATMSSRHITEGIKRILSTLNVTKP